MKQRKWLVGPATMAFALGSMSVSNAQPDENAVPKAANPTEQQPRGGRGNRPDWRNMTPVQREQAFAQQRDAFLRGSLDRNGITEKATQDAVVAFANAQETARRPLQEKADSL